MANIKTPFDPKWGKNIIYPGKGDLPNFSPGSKVTFHFKTSSAKNPDAIIDDSRLMKTPMELILGKKFKLEVWEELVQTMRIDEVASFTVPKDQVVCYPLISKSLRNLRDKVEPSSHCCGLVSQSLGYADLDKLLENPQDLIFTIELLKSENDGDYEKESWVMSETEKLNSIPLLKEKGNALYKDGKYDMAEKQYCEALGRLEQMMIREKPEEEEWLRLEKLKVPILLNFAQCKLLQEDYYSVIEHTCKIIERHPDNVKAIFRRAKAHVGVWNPEMAEKDFEKAMELDKSLTNLVKNELMNLQNLKKMKNDEDKKKLEGKIFPDI